MNIKMYFHLFPHNGWENYISRKLLKFEESGLWDRLDKIVFCTHYNESALYPIYDRFYNDPRVSFVYHPDAVTPFNEQYTNRTLKLQTDQDTEPSYILRYHMKGITIWPAKSDYDELLDDYNISKWESVITKLDQGYDTAGVWWVKQPRPHYMGNIWWATSEYIRRLPLLKMPHETGGQQQLPSLPGNPNVIWAIHDAEMWVGTANPKAYDLLRATDQIADHPAEWVHRK